MRNTKLEYQKGEGGGGGGKGGANYQNIFAVLFYNKIIIVITNCKLLKISPLPPKKQQQQQQKQPETGSWTSVEIGWVLSKFRKWKSWKKKTQQNWTTENCHA